MGTNPGPNPGTNVAPKTWLLESILVTLFCCLPLGIVGIVYASRVNNYVAQGDMVRAQEASANAKKWLLYGVIIGVGLIVVSGILQLLGVLGNWAFGAF